jgi:hypothetical protein
VAQNKAELQRVIDHARDIPYVREVVSYVRIKSDKPAPAKAQPAPPKPAGGPQAPATTAAQPAATP